MERVNLPNQTGEVFTLFLQRWKRNLIKCTSVFFSRDTDHTITVRSAKGNDLKKNRSIGK